MAKTRTDQPAPAQQFQPTAEDIRSALEAGQFTAFFQPICDNDGRIVASEALARWVHPQFGVIPADKFINLAEQAGLSGAISEVVLKATCDYQKHLASKGLRIPVSVNLSGQQLSDPLLADKIKQIIKTSKADRHLISFELTEQSALEDPEQAIATLKKLRQNGHRVYMDDVGEGHNNAELLQTLSASKAVDGIKFSRDATKEAFNYEEPSNSIFARIHRFLDRNILSGLKIGSHAANEAMEDANKRAELKQLVQYAHKHGLSVTFEGIENGMQEFAAEMGCDKMQGYAIGKPVAFTEYQGRLMQEKAMGNLLEEAHRGIDLSRFNPINIAKNMFGALSNLGREATGHKQLASAPLGA